MSDTNRETPICDRLEREGADGQARLQLARSLEQMCGELAEKLENHMFMTRPRDESKQALAKWDAMKKECGG